MKPSIRTLLLFAVMCLLGVVFAAPLLFMFASSFKRDDAIFANLTSWSAFIPDAGWSMANYTAIFERSNLPLFLLNSTIIAAFVVAGGVLVNSMLAFSLSRMRWRGRRIVLAVIVALTNFIVYIIAALIDPRVGY